MSNLNLYELIDSVKAILTEITMHPDFQALDFQPDVTIPDAMSALIYLEDELNSYQSFPKQNIQ